MQNLHIRQVIEDRTGKVQFHIYGHGKFSEDDLHKITRKKSLHEPAGTMTLYNTTFKVVKIVAADGWENAD